MMPLTGLPPFPYDFASLKASFQKGTDHQKVIVSLAIFVSQFLQLIKSSPSLTVQLQESSLSIDNGTVFFSWTSNCLVFIMVDVLETLL